MWLYAVALAVALGFGVYDIFTTRYGNLQFLFKIINVCMYGLAAFIFVTPWRAYRMGGGFYSDIKVDTLPEDVFLSWAGKIATQAGDKVAQKLDEKVPDTHDKEAQEKSNE